MLFWTKRQQKAHQYCTIALMDPDSAGHAPLQSGSWSFTAQGTSRAFKWGCGTSTSSFYALRWVNERKKTFMASTPHKLPTFSDGISPNSTMHEFNIQRENRAPFPSICDITEGLGPFLGGRQSYCRWKESDVHHLYCPQAFIIFPTSPEVGECCGLNFTDSQCKVNMRGLFLPTESGKIWFSPVLGPFRGN